MDYFIPTYWAGVVFFLLWSAVQARRKGLPFGVLSRGLVVAVVVAHSLLWPLFFPLFVARQWRDLTGKN